MKTKNKIIIIISILIILYFSIHLILYGSLTRNCIYTENKISVPKELTNKKIIVTKDVNIISGAEERFSCLQDIKKINNEIFKFNDTVIGIDKEYFVNKGFDVKTLKKDTQLTTVDIIAVTKHGLSTIDSDSGPIYYLILKDKNNNLYKIATVSLGSNKEDLFLAMTDSSNKTTFLTPFSFIEKQDGKYLQYVPKNLLNKDNNQQQNPLNNFSENELIDIQIEINKNGLVLSDDSNIRKKQITELQQDFLDNLNNTVGETVFNNPQKDPYHPYIKVQVTKDMLDYLNKNKYTLNIKQIAEVMK